MAEHEADRKTRQTAPDPPADTQAPGGPTGHVPPQRPPALPSSDRDPLEIVIEEFTDRHRRGEHPSVEEYVDRYPEMAEEIRELLDAATAMEQLKVRKERTPGGQTSLRGVHLERLGDFRIVQEIGRGGMGIVYEAVQESLDRRVAVKVLPKQALLDSKHLRRFQREARTAARLHHTNIVPVLGVGQHEGYHYYVMQLIDGTGLDGGRALAPTIGLEDTKVRRGDTATETFRPPIFPDGEPAPPATPLIQPDVPATEARAVARIGIQAAAALQYAHQHGVLHRDVKPANLILDSEQTVWVTDFGLAKILEQDSVTRSGDVVGTLRYIAPEQLTGVEVDARSDIYSLGITLYELATGRPAFGGLPDARVIEKIVAGDIARPRQLKADIPRDLETAILKAISCEPKDRYQSAGELAEDLRRFVADRPLLARRTTAVEHAWRWCRRNRLTATLIATALVLLVLMMVSPVVGYVQAKAALDRERSERERAEAATEVGLNVLDNIFEQFAPPRFDPLESLIATGMGGSDDEQQPLRPALSPDTAALLENMLTFYDSLAEQSGDNRRFRGKAAQANRRIGDIRQHLGQFDDAVVAYDRALDIYRELAETEGAGAFALEQAEIHNELGHAYPLTGQADQGHQSRLKAQKMLESVLSSDSSPEVGYELAQTYFRLAGADCWLRVPPTDLSRDRRDWGAEPPHAAPSPASGPGRQPVPPRRDHRPPPRRPADRRGPPQWFPSQVAGHESSSADTQERDTYLRKAIEALEPVVVPSSSDPDHCTFLALLHHARGTLQRHAGQADDALVSHRTAVSLQSDLAGRFPEKASYNVMLGWLQQPLGHALQEQGELNEARRLLESSRDILEGELIADPSMAYLHGLIAQGSLLLANVLYELGEAEAALQAYRLVEEHDEQMRRAFPRARRPA